MYSITETKFDLSCGMTIDDWCGERGTVSPSSTPVEETGFVYPT
jgi:hypothetical protein